jgi:hypothetical protein
VLACQHFDAVDERNHRVLSDVVIRNMIQDTVRESVCRNHFDLYIGRIFLREPPKMSFGASAMDNVVCIAGCPEALDFINERSLSPMMMTRFIGMVFLIEFSRASRRRMPHCHKLDIYLNEP